MSETSPKPVPNVSHLFNRNFSGGGKIMKDKLLTDFIAITVAINRSTTPSIKQVSKKCLVLNDKEVSEIFRKLNMSKVRTKRFNQSQELLPRRSNKEIREAIKFELKQAPQLSIYELSKSTKLAYSTIKLFIKKDQRILDDPKTKDVPLLRIAKSGNATYVILSEEYRND